METVTHRVTERGREDERERKRNPIGLWCIFSIKMKLHKMQTKNYSKEAEIRVT